MSMLSWNEFVLTLGAAVLGGALIGFECHWRSRWRVIEHDGRERSVSTAVRMPDLMAAIPTTKGEVLGATGCALRSTRRGRARSTDTCEVVR